MTAAGVRRLLKKAADPKRAAFLPSFFKTGPGQYAEGERFWGVTVPECRKIAREAEGLSRVELQKLLRAPFHEERTVALLIHVRRFERARTEAERRDLYRFYVRSMPHVNNWDLVDGSAPQVVGAFLWDKDKKPLYRWARSKRLWDRRVAVVATQFFIKNGRFEDTLERARRLRRDREDLIQKAVGWMLREVGKRDRAVLERFLETHCRDMGRTSLRYAIEHFPEPKRKRYLEGRV